VYVAQAVWPYTVGASFTDIQREYEANTRLIAAAPTLYAVLRNVIEVVTKDGHCLACNCYHGTHSAYCPVADALGVMEAATEPEPLEGARRVEPATGEHEPPTPAPQDPLTAPHAHGV
jgi:hypothetical protein